jgi:hypothetical protein
LVTSNMCTCDLSAIELTNMMLIMISIIENTTQVAIVAYPVALVPTLVDIESSCRCSCPARCHAVRLQC